ncbi:MAG TPA: hypothetical protein VK666_05700 [Chryseolinea sp.]|nr:hypothetical protein [Chryseolinea sp.]
MTSKKFLLTLLYVIIVDIGLVLVATFGDIVLTVSFSGGMAPVCFAVAGVFAGALCYIFALEKASGKGRQQASPYIVVVIAVISGLLYYPVSPLSGSDYSLAFKCFAVTQLLMAVFLWRAKFYRVGK